MSSCFSDQLRQSLLAWQGILFFSLCCYYWGVRNPLVFVVVDSILPSNQVHHEELETVVDMLKSGMVTGISGHQNKLHYEARCDIMGVLWRIFGVNGSAQRVFGEATGFSLLLTTLHTFQAEGECEFSFLLCFLYQCY